MLGFELVESDIVVFEWDKWFVVGYIFVWCRLSEMRVVLDFELLFEVLTDYFRGEYLGVELDVCVNDSYVSEAWYLLHYL